MASQFSIRRFASGSYLVLLTGVVVAAGFVWYVTRYQYRKVMLTWEARQTTVVADRAHIISNWLMERRADAEVASVARCARVLLSSNSGQMPFPPISQEQGGSPTLMLDTIKRAYSYTGIYVLDREGRLVGRAAGSVEMPLQAAEIGRSVVQSGQFRVDFLREDAERVLISFSMPVFEQWPGDSAGGASRSALGLVTLVSDANKDLFAFLTTEVVPTKTGETVLLVREGKEVLYFSPLRHAPSGLARLRPALNDSNFGAKAALEGREVFGEFIDYRGVRVLAALRRIPLTGWGLMSKIDRDEALTDFRYTAWVRAITAGFLILVLASGVSSYRQYLSAMIMKEEEEKFRSLLESAPDGLVIMDRRGRIALVNWQAERLFGYERSELVKGPFKTLVPEESYRQIGERNAGPFVPAEVPRLTLALEAEGRRKDGSRFPIEISFSPIASKEDTLVCAGIRDITERKQAQEALEQAAKRFKLVTLATQDAVFDWDLVSHEIWRNETYQRLFGAPERNLDSDNWWNDRLHPEDRERVLTAQNAALGGAGNLFSSEFRLRRPDGSYADIVERSHIVRGAQGQAVRMIGALTDISERKRAEEALRENEDRYRDLVEHSQDLICTHDLDGHVLSVNEPPARSLGYERSELLKMRIQDILVPEVRGEFGKYVAVLRRDGAAQGLMLVQTASGERRIWEYNNTLRTEGVPAPIVRGLAHDVTERNRAQEALRMSEQRYRELADSIADVFFATDKDLKYTYWNKASEDLTGIPARDAMGKSLYQLFPHVVGTRWEELYLEALETGRPRSVIDEFRIEGQLKTFEINVYPSRNGLSVFARDVTERRRAEEALRASEQFNREVIASAREGIVVYDRELRYQVWNRFMEELSGVPASQVLGKQGFDVFPHLHEYKLDALLQRALEGQVVHTPDMHFRVPLTGKSGWASSVLNPHFGPNGEIIGVISVIHDITERKQAEQALRAAEEKFRKAFDACPEPMAIRTIPEGRYLEANNAFALLAGCPREEIIGKTVRELGIYVNGEDLDRMNALIARDGKVHDYEAPLGWKSRELIHALLSAERIELGGLPCLLVVAKDITERKRMEQALKASEQRYREFISRSTDAVWRVEFEEPIPVDLPEDETLARFLRGGVMAECNDAMARVFGLSRAEELIGRRMGELPTGADAGRLESYRSAVRNGLRPRSVAFQTTDAAGKPLYLLRMEVPTVQEGRLIRVWGITRDITEHKRAEEALQQSEERYRGLFENSLEGIGVSKGNKVLDANRALLDIFGYSDLEEFKALPLLEHVAPQSRGLIKAIWEKQDRGEPYPKRFEYQIIRKNGEVRSLEISTDRVSFGSETYTQSTFRDITERKRAEEALAASEQRYRELFENANDIVCSYDLTGNFTSVNTAGERSSGYTRGDPTSINMLQLLAPEYLEEGRRVLEGLAAGREPGIREFEIIAKDGRRVWLEASTRLVRRNGELVEVQVIARDITERKRAEEELRRSLERLRALAARLQRAREEERTSVAREIHDELGQALTAIKIDLSSVIRELPEDKKGRPGSILELVDQTIQSVRRIASELRPAILDALGLVAALEWAAEEFEVRTGIKCRLDLPQKDIVIEQESATALFRIFQETLTNVVRHADATEVNVRLARKEGSLTLSIRDNGKGIDAEQLSSSRSLGILGMRERALLLGGELDIRGAPRKGTTVRVCIPEDHPTQSEGAR